MIIRTSVRSTAMMTGVSLLALCAMTPGLALAQDTLTGSPGQALTAGQITTTTGVINDQGVDRGVFAPVGANAVVTVDGAVIDNLQTQSVGLWISSQSAAAGEVSVTTTGGVDISATSRGLYVDTNGEDIMVDTTAGGGRYAGQIGISASSVEGDITILNGANTIVGTAFGLSASASGAAANVVVDSSGGSIIGGVAAATFGSGDVTVGQGQAFSTSVDSSQNGIQAIAFGAGAGNVIIDIGADTVVFGDMGAVYARVGGTGDVTVTSAAGSRIEANQYSGVYAEAYGGGDITLNLAGEVVGGANGAIFVNGGAGDLSITTNVVDATAGGVGVYAYIGAGAITVDARGPITAASFGIDVENMGAADVRILAGAVTSLNTTAVAGVSASGDVYIGSADARMGAVTGGTTGIFAATAGDIYVYADAVNGGTRGIVAASQYTDPNGVVVVDVAGPLVAAGSFGIIGVNNGVLATNTIDITASGSVTSTNGSAISAQSVNGDITIQATDVTANAGPNNATWDGVFAEAEGDAIIDITTTGAVFGTFNGIEALIGGDGTRGGISIAALGDVQGDSTFGVRALSTGGGIAVTTGGSLSGAQGGVDAVVTGAGSIAIEAGGPITTAGVGLSATTVVGDIAITTLAEGDIAPGAQIGILAQTDTGAITINQAGDIGAIEDGMTVPTGIHATIASGDAALTIVSTGGIYVTPGEGLESAGIYVSHGGTGAITVTTSGIIDPGAYGVVMQGGGDVTYTADGGLVEGDVGVFLASTGDGAVSFTSTEGTEVIGLTGAGVQAETGAGDLVLVLDGTTTGATTGLIAASTGAGTTSLTSNGDIVGLAGPGIEVASGTGGLDLTINGVVASATGSAINATSAGAATVNVGAGAVITGLVDTADTAVINLTTASGLTSTINVAEGGVIAAADGSAFNVAIRAEGGSVVVNNEGTIAGTVDFSALTGENTGELVSGPDTVFLTGGTSTFSAGDDNFNNGGVLATLGELTTFDFREGTNVFTNTGETQVGFNPVLNGGSRFALLNVTTFNNSGTLEMANGVAGDSIVAEGADFVASGASLLSIDTEVGQTGGRSDTLSVGQSSGRTGIRINNVGAGFSGLDTTGILLVSGDTSEGDFVIDAGSTGFSADFGGVIDAPGLFFARLATDARGAVLITAPKTEAYQFATLGAQAQSVWRATAGSGERQAQRRDRMAANTGQGLGGLNVWADVQGLASQRDVDQSFGATDHDAGYDQDIATVTFGVEGVQAGYGGLVSYGVSVGYVTSDTQFDSRQTQVDMTGGALTAHVGYLSPAGLFAAASVVGNALEADVDAAQLNGFSEESVDLTTLGGSIEVGVRRPFAFNSVLEPSVSLTYSDTTIDSLGAAGSTVRFQDADSLRAAAGVRMSGDVGSLSGAWRTRYTLGAAVVNEFSGENGSEILNSGSTLAIVDTFDGVFGELRAGVSSQSVGGWTVFGEGAARFNSDSSEIGLTAGIRLRY